MEDQYGMADLGPYVNGRDLFQPVPRKGQYMNGQQDLLSSRRGLAPPRPYDMIVFCSDDTASTVAAADNIAGGNGAASVSSTVADDGLCGGGGGDGVAGRWPRQETLTLLEIRSRLDSRFKEANQKGPLWDEVSRIMSEEHGYQRSGKKCREKFENLYKYYKKTKEGKGGRQDGKHYRFFRQLEALCGETNNSASASASEIHLKTASFNPNLPKMSTSSANNQESYPGFKFSDTSLSPSNSWGSDPTSSNDDRENNPNMKKRRGKMGWKVKIKDFIDAQMKRLMDKQEAWMEKMMKTIEDKEKERILREEEWRKQDAERMERERKLWASERAWIEARDASLMDTLHKMARKESRASPQVTDIRSLSKNYQKDDGSETITNSLKGDVFWPEFEVSRLIQLRNGMELKFQKSGISEEILWEEIAKKMACFGHERSGLICREKWESINNYLLIKCNKKRKDNARICGYCQNSEFICSQGGGSCFDNSELNHDQVHNDNGTGETCIRYFVGDVYGRIME